MSRPITVEGIGVGISGTMGFFSFSHPVDGSRQCAVFRANRLFVHGHKIKSADYRNPERFEQFFMEHVQSGPLRADVMPNARADEAATYITTGGLEVRPKFFSRCVWTGQVTPPDHERILPPERQQSGGAAAHYNYPQTGYGAAAAAANRLADPLSSWMDVDLRRSNDVGHHYGSQPIVANKQTAGPHMRFRVEEPEQAHYPKEPELRRQSRVSDHSSSRNDDYATHSRSLHRTGNYERRSEDIPILENPIMCQANDLMLKVLKCSSPDDDANVDRILSDDSDVQLAMFVAKTLEYAAGRYRNSGEDCRDHPHRVVGRVDRDDNRRVESTRRDSPPQRTFPRSSSTREGDYDYRQQSDSYRSTSEATLSPRGVDYSRRTMDPSVSSSTWETF